MQARRAVLDTATLAFLALLVGLVGLRVWALRLAAIDLYFDEAQYWAWSRTLELGYFSKPPLIAWTIASTTALFGDAEWAVRLAAPIGHGIAALALFVLGRTLYGSWAGFWAGLSWLVMPAVWLSSGIISTDALLLPLWSLGLLALWRLAATRAWIWAIALGFAVGLGVLAKYAMLYFPVCALLAAWWSMPVRAVLFNPRGIVATVIAVAILSPNLYWNFAHSFATVAHTASNASLGGGDFINFDEVLQFLIEQGGVIGPLMFIALLGLFGRALMRMAGLSDEDKFLLAFILPPLVIITVQAFLSRADAHWAATSYPAAIVWICGSLIGGKRGRRFLAGAAVVNVLIGGAIAATAIDLPLADRLPGFANSIKRLRAWEETAQLIATRALAQPGEAPFTAVLVDDRETFYQLVYNWRIARQSGAPLPPVRMWVLHGDPRNSAELSDPMRPEEGARVLVVHANPQYLPLVAGDFTVFRRVEHLSIPRGAARNREFEISVAEGFAPAPRDAAFESRIPR